ASPVRNRRSFSGARKEQDDPPSTVPAAFSAPPALSPNPRLPAAPAQPAARRKPPSPVHPYPPRTGGKRPPASHSAGDTSSKWQCPPPAPRKKRPSLQDRAAFPHQS